MKCRVQIRIPRKLVHKQALHKSPKGDKHNYYFGIEFKLSLGPLYIIIWNVDVMNDFEEHRIAMLLVQSINGQHTEIVLAILPSSKFCMR
jgi:hypothetical protein